MPARQGEIKDLSLAGPYQGIELAAGNQSKFNWKELGAAAIEGAIEGPMGLVGSNAVRDIGDKAGFLTTVWHAAETSAIHQSANIAVDNQKKFDWTALAVGSIEAGAAWGMSHWLDRDYDPASNKPAPSETAHGRILVGTAQVIAGAVTRSVITGQDLGKSAREELPGVIGGTIGQTFVSFYHIGETQKPKPDAAAAADPQEQHVPTCFLAGTLVHTDRGLKPIEQIAVGVLVAARDENDHAAQVKLRRVEKTFEHLDATVLHLTIAHPDGTRERLSTTHEHPFFVDGAWRPAGQLAVGDSFDRIDGQTSVLAAIDVAPERHTVYNLTVEDDHTYFVGVFGIWVHNKYWIDPESPDFAGPDAAPPKRGLLGTIGDWLGFDGKFGPGGTQQNLSWGGFTTAVSNSFHVTTATPAGPANPDNYGDTTTVVVITGRDPYRNGLILDALKGNGNKLLGEFMHGRWLPSKDVWTQNADTVSHYAPDVVALNYLADRTKTVPLVSTIARVNAAMAEGRTRGTLHFLINGINDINGIVKDPFGTAVAAAKGMVAGDIYMAKAYFGFANPLADGYKLVKSAIDGENNKFLETYKTKGYYPAVVGGSADGTEFGGNILLTVAPGTDAIEGARIVSGAAKAEQLVNGLRGADELADLGTLTADAGQAAKTGMPPALRAGRFAEVDQLTALNAGGKISFTPTQAQIDSSAFKVIVGDGKYTVNGTPVGTIFDGTVGNGLGEIKTGTSVLDSSYQLRLQTYGALVNDMPYAIYTNRPVNPTFGDWLTRWGVEVKPLPKP